MRPVISPRRTFEQVARLEAPPGEVFPLLCPVREYDWIPAWRCELLYTASGVAEEGCLFRTAAPDGSGGMTWVVTRYEPPARIDFACVAPGLVMRLQVTLVAAGHGTDVRWRREYTATSPVAEQWLAALEETDVSRLTATLFAQLAYYLRHGTPMPDDAR